MCDFRTGLRMLKVKSAYTTSVFYMMTYVAKVCTLASWIFSMMLACGSTRLSRADKCSMILSSLVGQPFPKGRNRNRRLT